MSNSDDELKKLFKPLAQLVPDDLQMQKWQAAVKREILTGSVRRPKGGFRFALQLTAAVFVGIVIGAVLFGRNSSNFASLTQVANISNSDATYENSHTNLD